MRSPTPTTRSTATTTPATSCHARRERVRAGALVRHASSFAAAPEGRAGDRVQDVVVAGPGDDGRDERCVRVGRGLHDQESLLPAISAPVTTANATWRLGIAATGL